MTYKQKTLDNIRKIIDKVTLNHKHLVGDYLNCDMCDLYGQTGHPDDNCKGCFAAKRDTTEGCTKFFVYIQLDKYQRKPDVRVEIIEQLTKIRDILSKLPANRFVPKTAGYFPELDEFRATHIIKS